MKGRRASQRGTDADELAQVVDRLEGNLTGAIYSHTGGDDDVLYGKIAPRLRWRVGRLLNDKMPTGVALSPAMNHGGPYPCTGHPGFTAVGMAGYGWWRRRQAARPEWP